jgi:GT2 family glycosyltransferase
MRLSIVVPAYNAENDLPHLLHSLTAANPPLADELIVVDDHSEDRTRDVAAAFPSVRVVSMPYRSGAAAARNAGVAAAASDEPSSQAIIFLDADVVPHAGTIAALQQRLIDQPGLAAVIGSYDDRPAHPAVISQYRNLLHCYTHHHGRPDASTFWTACGIVRRDWFDRLGGFDPAIAFMEDIDFGMRLKQAGGCILLDPTIQVQHRKGWTLRGMIRMDVFHRAVPWSRLIFRRGAGFPDDLNVRADQRLAAALVCLAAVGTLAAFWIPMLLLAAGACLAGVAVINRGFYGFLLQRRGLPFTIAAFGLHLIYYGCSVAGLILALRERGGPRLRP